MYNNLNKHDDYIKKLYILISLIVLAFLLFRYIFSVGNPEMEHKPKETSINKTESEELHNSEVSNIYNIVEKTKESVSFMLDESPTETKESVPIVEPQDDNESLTYYEEIIETTTETTARSSGRKYYGSSYKSEIIGKIIDRSYDSDNSYSSTYKSNSNKNSKENRLEDLAE